ncbi:MAG TPA: WbuC family cupin fold metalloprotein [Geobacteraceae bacterium]
MNIIDRQLLDELSRQARENPRLRKNYNLHPSDDFCAHRLLNAMEPGSYIRPHRHLDPLKDESMAMVRGSMGIVAFDEAGNVILARILSAGGDAVAVDIPHGSYHTVVSLEKGTIFFEAKAGPYIPLTEEEKAPWAPAEGDATVAAYLARLEALFHTP